MSKPGSGAPRFCPFCWGRAHLRRQPSGPTADCWSSGMVDREQHRIRTSTSGGTEGLPPVILARIVSRVLRSGAPWADLARSLPLLAVFASTWVAVDVLGGWIGEGVILAKVT